MERVCLLVVTGVALLVSATAGSAQPVKTGKQQEALWLHRVIPLPKQIAIPAHVTLPATEVGLRLRSGAGDVEKQAAAELKALFDAQTGAALSGDGFQIHIGVADAQGRMGAAVVPEVRQLVGLPNSEQAYVIVPVGERKLVVAGLDERGVYYATRTLQDLLQGAFADGRVTIPLATVVDWPDMAERGEWGGSAAGDIEWMAARKLNLVELHAGMKVNAEGRGVATIDQGKITAGRLRALKVVPIIMHLDYLHGTGLYERYPGVVGVGNAARTGAGGDPVALCFSQPKSTEMLADWMRSLAAYEGVTDIMVWLSEYHGRCECEACDAALQQGVTQHALEVQAVGKALDILREDYPRLNARVLLTQGTYPDNDKVLAATPDNVQVSYYCGGGRERSTYNSSPEPMIYPLLEDYAASGRWLGVYPQFTASYGTICPWSGPQFIKHLIGEFVDKGLDCVCGYTVPSNQLHDFNVTAAAEWSWNRSGRSEREFAVAWATRRGTGDPEAVGDWVELLGPISWRIYGSGVGATPWLSILQQSARSVAGGSRPTLGQGIWRYYESVEDIDRDLAATADALAIARTLSAPEILQETQLVQAYVTMVKSLVTIGTTLARADLTSDEVRGSLQREVCELTNASFRGVRALQAWVEGIAPGLSTARLDATIRGTEQTAVVVADALSAFGIQDPAKPYRPRQIGKWDSADGQVGAVRAVYELGDYLTRPGEYIVRFDYESGMQGLGIRRVALVSAPKDDPENRTEISVDEHWGFAGNEDRDHVYRASLERVDLSLRYAILADFTVTPSSAGTVRMYLDVDVPDSFSVPELQPLTEEQRSAIQSRTGGPTFSTGGLRVGVVQGGYGSPMLLGALAGEADIDAQPVWHLSKEPVEECQVVILPQPRVSGAVGPQQAHLLADWVARGGGLIATHDAVGYRGLPAIVPDVCRGGAEKVRGELWAAVLEHPVTAGIALSHAREHSYYDHIALEPGPQGTVVAVGAEGKDPVVVCGVAGKGRYVACGMAIGLGPDDEDIAPAGAERALLLNAVRWCGGQ